MNHSHWSNYWQSGVQTSLPQDFKNNYDGTIYQFWQQLVKSLDKPTKVVDVCTGNGAVALILAEIAENLNKQISITAVDISDINTDYIKNNNPHKHTKKIHFISQCPVERLHQCLPEQQDLIVSQYGLEYSSLNESAKSLAKTLKPGGQLVFIAHSPQSAVFNFMQKEESIYAWLQKVGLLAAFNKFAERKHSAEIFKKNLQTILSQHRPNADYKDEPLFINWIQLIVRLRSLNAEQIIKQKHFIYDFVRQHEFARQRTNDMLQVAVKLKDKNWISPLVSEGFVLKNQKELYYQNSHLVGDCYEFCLEI